MIDIHTHLYWNSYNADRDEVIARARAARVERMFVIGTTVEESRQAVALAEQYPELFASVGIHPHFFSELGIENQESGKPIIHNSLFQIPSEIKEVVKNTVAELQTLAQSSKKIVAIGECGLDYYSHDPKHDISEKQKADQEMGFLAQIALAQELRLPLIVHCRSSSPTADDAYRDLLRILQATSHKLPTILHCYLGDTEVTKKFLKLPNVSFSFAGNITYPVRKSVAGTKDDLTETVKLVPLERLFVETDCPFLAPQDHRGKRNEPAFVVAVAAWVAAIKEVSRVEVEAQSMRHAVEIFGHLE